MQECANFVSWHGACIQHLRIGKGFTSGSNQNRRPNMPFGSPAAPLKAVIMKLFCSLVIAAVGLLMSGQYAFAQLRDGQIHDAGWKIRGDYSYGSSGHQSAQSAGRYLQSARDCSQDFYQYSNTAPVVTPAIAKKDSQEIAKNAEAAKKDLESLRKAAVDKLILVKLDAIEKHLSAAMNHHKMMHGECCKAEVDGQKTTECCNEMITEIEKAQAEHRALMRMIAPSKLVVANKPKA